MQTPFHLYRVRRQLRRLQTAVNLILPEKISND